MKKAIATILVMAVLGSIPAAIAQPATDGFSLQAWCVGGFAGRWDKAQVYANGEIRVTNSAITPEPWPVAATEPALATEWLTTAIDVLEGTIDNGPPVYRDGINCGLDLYAPDGTRKPVPLVDVFNALFAYVPPRGF